MNGSVKLVANYFSDLNTTAYREGYFMCIFLQKVRAKQNKTETTL